MSDKISRRAFLPFPKAARASPSCTGSGAEGAKNEPQPFSLSAFYARRTPGGAPLPRFAVSLASEKVETTIIGLTRSAVPPWKLKREPRDVNAPKLGGPVAVVRSACLAWQGSPCWTCSERCPAAFAITLDAGRPTIDPARCDGCGECVAACPAPHNALKLALPGGKQ